MNYRDILFYKYLHGSGGSQPAWDGATFSSYAKGTEQILPENEADPDSSPFLGDIRYPDGTRRNNYFLYRESPNTVDGQARITKIKGNTVVFNQLVENGNFASTSGWDSNFGTLAVSNNKCTLTVTKAISGYLNRDFSFLNGHKYLFFASVKASRATSVRFLLSSVATGLVTLPIQANVETRYSCVVTMTADYNFLLFYANVANTLAVNDTVEFSNVMLIDLTQLNNSAITDASSFRAYFNLPYYDYTTGKLLPFVGIELKIIGHNLVGYGFDTQAKSHDQPTTITQSGNRVTVTVTAYGDGLYIDRQLIAGKSYRLQGDIVSGETSNIRIFATKEGVGNYQTIAGSSTAGVNHTFVCENNGYIRIWLSKGTIVIDNLLLEESTSAVDYEPPYSILSLPTSSYFPTGMKSAGSVYDEITESKAITRIGSVDLGTLTWEFVSASSWNCFRSTISGKKNGETNVLCGIYNTSRIFNTTTDKIVFGNSANTLIYIRDNSFNGDYSAFKTAMSGQYLFYVLENPTEEPISSQTQIQNQALSTILGKTVSVDSPEEPLNILLKGE